MLEMKSLKIFIVLVMAILLSGCGWGTNRLIDKYEIAIQAGDYDRAVEYYNKLANRRLTDEQAMRVANITTNGGVNKIQKMYLRGARKVGECFSDERVEKTMDAYDKAIDEGLAEYDKALDEYLDEEYE